MPLIADKSVKIFDLSVIQRGDCARVKRAGDNVYRNGFVTKVTEQMIEVLYCNVQNNATSYLQLTAADVSVGVWEVYWTTDFQAVNHE